MAGEGLAPLVAFREAWYGCLGRRRDALFELTDALLTGVAPPSLAHLSLAPLHRRGWGSVYAALRRGEVAGDRLRDLLLRQPGPAGPPDYAVDVSVWPRRDAATSPERGFYYYPPAKHRQPVVEGWAYQWIARLTPDRDSWTAPADVRRVRPWEKPNEVAAAQVPALAARMPPGASGAPPLFVFDAGYDAAHFSETLAGAPVMLLIRLRSHRVFYADPEPDPDGSPRGRRPRDGTKFVCDDPATWPAPTAELRGEDAAYGRVSVQAWGGLHSVVRRPILRPRGPGTGRSGPRGAYGRYRGPRLRARGAVLRLAVERLPSRRRAPAVLWLWWQGPHGRASPGVADLERCWRAYTRRYDLEQAFRFMKQTLGWVLPHVRSPEQADRWTWLVVAAYTQLRLARAAVADRRLPWERPLPAQRLTPARVRRGLVTLVPVLPPLAAAPKPCGRSPGRPKGRRSAPAARYPPVKKAA